MFFFEGREICGKVMCHLCVFGWPDANETYRSLCKGCKEGQGRVHATTKGTSSKASTTKVAPPNATKKATSSTPPTKKTISQKTSKAKTKNSGKQKANYKVTKPRIVSVTTDPSIRSSRRKKSKK